jgi:hypothetical protein
MEFTDFDAELADWNELRATTPFSDLLVGNGASMAVWKNFSYYSLFEESETTRNKPLSQTELAVFKAMGTTNFEPILSALKTAMRVNAALTISSSSPRNRYFAIKEALIHAVRSVHIPWRLVEQKSLLRISQELSQYRNVFSSNYDLLCYWAVMQAPEKFNDLFGDDATFDPHRSIDNATRMLYLHGGLLCDQCAGRRADFYQRRHQRQQSEDDPPHGLPRLLQRATGHPQRGVVCVRPCPRQTGRAHRRGHQIGQHQDHRVLDR